MKAAEFTHYQFMATLDRRTCARCGERDGEVYKLSEMNQGENAPPMHARCRCTIVAYDGLQYGTRAARDFGDSLKGKSADFEGGESGGKKIKTPFGEVNGTKVKIKLSDGEVVDHYRRVPADMSYRDWKAVYIDKTKTFETWQAEFDARRQADEQSPLRQRGRQVIDDLSAGRLPTAASGGKVAATKSTLDEAAIRAKLDAVKSEFKIKGELIYPPPKFDLSTFKFDATHTQGDKHPHAVTEQEARQFIEDAYFAIAKLGANSYNYWGKNGAAYVQPNLKRIRTAFKSEEYAPPYRRLIEVFEDARGNLQT